VSSRGFSAILIHLEGKKILSELQPMTSCSAVDRRDAVLRIDPRVPFQLVEAAVVGVGNLVGYYQVDRLVF
jgi:hypothetical protein